MRGRPQDDPVRLAGRAHSPGPPPPAARYFDVEPEARVLAHCHWQADPSSHPTLLMLHGLNGSSSAHYMRGLPRKHSGGA